MFPVYRSTASLLDVYDVSSYMQSGFDTLHKLYVIKKANIVTCSLDEILKLMLYTMNLLLVFFFIINLE